MINLPTAMLSLLLVLDGTGDASFDLRRAPEVPSSLEVSRDYIVSSRVFAAGVQIYTATPSPTDPTKLVWTFTAPEALLFDADGTIVGRHFAYDGPTRPGWESNSGSLVVGARTIPPVTVDPTAVPWLLLDAVYTEGPGIFARTVFIQRVHTTGGLAPANAPVTAGQVARVPYTADYVFYRLPKPSSHLRAQH